MQQLLRDTVPFWWLLDKVLKPTNVWTTLNLKRWPNWNNI